MAPDTSTIDPAPFVPQVIPAHPIAPSADPLLRLIELSTEKGTDASALKNLYDLYERHTKAQAVKAFAEDMNLAQTKMPAVLKDRQNAHTKSAYSGLDSVQKIAKPVYTAHGFSISFGTADSPIQNYIRVVAHVRHRGGHCETHHLDLPIDGVGAKGGNTAMNAVQGHGSTVSYGQRYLLKMIFNMTLTDELDDDGQSTGIITQDQVVALNDLLEEARIEGDRFRKFLAVYNIERLDMMPVKSFDEACRKLNAVIEKNKKEGGK